MSDLIRRRKQLTGKEGADAKSAPVDTPDNGIPSVETSGDKFADPSADESNSKVSQSSSGPLSQDPLNRPVRGRLRDDDIEAKSGNYLMSFGYAGAGKTTFQSFLAYYVNHSPEFRSRLIVDPESSVQGWEPQAIYNDWLKLWTQGDFPKPTDVDDSAIRELTFEVNPKKGVKTPAKFSFLEVSGELLRQVIAHEEDPNLTETIRRYFENPSIRMTLVLLVDPEHDQDGANDLLFQNLFTFLEVNYPGFAARSSLALLISKPEQALTMLKNAQPGLRHHAELRGDLCEDYIETFLPGTYNIFDSWPNPERTAIMTLHLGEVEGEGDHARLVSPDYKDISSIFNWLYHDITRERLGPKWWQRIYEWIRS